MTTNGKATRIPKAEVVHDDVWRMAKAMRRMLIRKYPDPEERQVVAAKIMREVRAAA